MIVFFIYERMAHANIRTFKELAKRMGRPNWRFGPYMDGTATLIDVAVMDDLCRVLDCSPGDLFKHRKVSLPSERGDGDELGPADIDVPD